ncbi:hypothetical protein FJ954_10460 [Mesorhizobium sp. B2-3-15]|nr:hypothetical protein FJ954_10460 [Mesorhizobium sp. B2-3-15]
MALSRRLLMCNMTFECPHCGFALKRAGSWFQVVSSRRCEGCQRQFRITYTDKLTLFAKHEQEAVLEAHTANRQIAS